MKFCRHDWHTHKKFGYENSFRYWLLREENGFFPATGIVIGAAYASAIPVILNKFFTLPGGAITALVITIMVSVIGFIWRDAHVRNVGNDPWRKTDRSCVKCGIVRFDATNKEIRVAKAKVKQDKQDKIKSEYSRVLQEERIELCSKANDRYNKLIELQKMARFN